MEDFVSGAIKFANERKDGPWSVDSIRRIDWIIMKTIKPQNLEELIDQISFRFLSNPPRGFSTKDTEAFLKDFQGALCEVARATLDAVRVKERYKEDIHYTEKVIYNQGTKTAIYKLGRNSAVKAQESKVKDWLGGGGDE